METASAPQRYPIDASADALQSAISGQISLRDDGAHPSHVSVAQLSSVSFLGTSSAQPVPGKRNMSSLVIATEAGSGIMVDFGKAPTDFEALEFWPAHFQEQAKVPHSIDEKWR